jgi:hypothetical protein
MFKKEQSSRPEIKDLAKEYLNELSGDSQVQLINKVYFNLYNKKPDREMNPTQLLNRILYRQKFGKYIDDTTKSLENKKKKFKWPAKWKRIFKSSKKQKNQILVWFLNIKGEIEAPRLYPIYQSNMVIISNRPYEIDPRSFWRMGKYTCQIIKGIDRRPVSNLDYAEIKKRGDATDADEFLIRAALQAVAGDIKPKKPISKKTLIIIGLIAAAAVIYFMTTGAGA